MIDNDHVSVNINLLEGVVLKDTHFDFCAISLEFPKGIILDSSVGF